MAASHKSQPSIFKNLTVQILIAMLLGAFLGIYVHNSYPVEGAKEFSGYIKMLATIFIRLGQMIISPLVFTTLVVGIAKLGDFKSVGRIGGEAMARIFSASLISLPIGIFYVNYLEPGAGLNLSDIDMSSASAVTENTKVFSVQNFVEHIFPKSIVEAMPPLVITDFLLLSKTNKLESL